MLNSSVSGRRTKSWKFVKRQVSFVARTSRPVSECVGGSRPGCHQPFPAAPPHATPRPKGVNLVVLSVRRSLPIYLDKRTFSESVGTSRLCHKRSLGFRGHCVARPRSLPSAKRTDRGWQVAFWIELNTRRPLPPALARCEGSDIAFSRQ